jgi:hypothetical protein
MVERSNAAAHAVAAVLLLLVLSLPLGMHGARAQPASDLPANAAPVRMAK